MARVLVFGAGGYIGIPLCEALEARGHWVQAADRFYFGKYPKLVTAPLRADIRTYQCGDGLFDAVIDLAGLSNDATADIDPDITRSINLDGARHLADLAKRIGVKKYIYSSSCSVYGAGGHVGLVETDACAPITLYAESKVRTEDHLRSLEGDGFKPIILRNATVFGPAKRMRFDLAVNIMVLRAMREGVIYQMGGGEQWRPFVDIADVVDAFVWALESDDAFGTYNVGHDAMNYTIEKLASVVRRQLPKAKIHKIPDEPDKRSYNVSFKRIAEHSAIPFSGMILGILDIKKAITLGKVSGDDETCYTLQFYRSMLRWESRLNAVRLDGKIL